MPRARVAAHEADVVAEQEVEVERRLLPAEARRDLVPGLRTWDVAVIPARAARAHCPVGVLEHDEVLLVPAADSSERRGAVQRGGAGGVIELARLAERRAPDDAASEVVRLAQPPQDRRAGVPQTLRLVVVEDRPGHARCARLEGGHRDGVLEEVVRDHDVVVQQQHVAAAQLERPGDADVETGREPLVRRQTHDLGFRVLRAHGVGGAIDAVVVDDDDPVVRVALALHGREALTEILTAVVGDDEHHDERQLGERDLRETLRSLDHLPDRVIALRDAVIP